ncbi:MAG: hypothetical protein ACRCUI_06075 [Polymorphobacter sp.]
MSLLVATSFTDPDAAAAYHFPANAHGNRPAEDVDLLLDMVARLLRVGVETASALNLLNAGLKMARTYMSAADWAAFCARAQQHALVKLLKEDPFIARVNDKPRGYAGDAVMIDLIYRTGNAAEILAGSSGFGQRVHASTSMSATSSGVRERREILARMVDATAEVTVQPTIFAVAAGHLREAALSTAFAQGRVGRWIALDQDADSIAEINGTLGDSIETVAKPVAAILKGEYGLAEVDFAYAAGLYDYLPAAIAIRLTRKLGSMLRPGGRLLFANFAADIWDSGFMEAIMDWKLILRTPAEMVAIANAAGHGFSARHWTGVHGAIHYCELRRL